MRRSLSLPFILGRLRVADCASEPLWSPLHFGMSDAEMRERAWIQRIIAWALGLRNMIARAWPVSPHSFLGGTMVLRRAVVQFPLFPSPSLKGMAGREGRAGQGRRYGK